MSERRIPQQASPGRAIPQAHIVFLISHLGEKYISTKLSDLVMRVLASSEQDARVSIAEHAIEDALEYARRLEREQAVTVFVCAGATASYLRKNLSTPVVVLAAGDHDRFAAFASAAAISSRIGLLSYRTIDSDVERAKHLFTFKLHQRCYLNANDAELRIGELANAGCNVIIGTPIATEIAQRAGLHAVLVYSEHAVRRALDEAVSLCRAERAEALKRRRLDSILQHLREGVVAVDSNGLIETINPAAAAALNVDRSAALGKPIDSVMAECSLARPIMSQSPDIDRVVKLGRRSLVVTRIPLMEDNAWTGGVMTLQEATAVQRADRSIRLHNRPRSEVAKYHISHLGGNDPAIQRLRKLAERYALTESTVLITGESGTGKELLAQGIHNASPRRRQPFVAVNCAALPEATLESELFGYEEGAFTGSRRGGKMGFFEAAHQGTIFLDEIGDMPLVLQTRLLRVLQEREVHRLGAIDPTPVDVRVIAATNVDLLQEVEAGRFRADLFYRLNIIRVSMPPLRERLDDLPLLLEQLTEKICLRLKRDVPPANRLEPLVAYFTGYAWPGNIRELENVLERYLANFDGDDPPDAATLRMIMPEHSNDRRSANPVSTLKSHSRERDLDLLKMAIAQCGGNYKAAASLLGISYTTLWRRMKDHQA